MFKYTHHGAVQGIFESNREDSWIQAFTWLKCFPIDRIVSGPYYHPFQYN